MGILNEFKRQRVILLAMPQKDYDGALYAMVEEVQHAYGGVCYVSVTKPCRTIARGLKEAGAELRSVYVTAPKSRAAKCGLKGIKCTGHGTTVLDISMGMYKLIDAHQPAAVVVEPITSLTKHSPKMEAVKFIHYVANDSRKSGRKLLLVCRKSDLRSEFVKDVQLFVDRVIGA